MKNTLLKVWGIALTLAILAGLLLATVPAAAGDLAWTTLTSPALTQGTNANVFAFAADGKTMYMYTSTNTSAVTSSTTLQVAIAALADPTTITVASAAGFPYAGDLLISGKTASYTGVTTTATYGLFTGVTWPTHSAASIVGTTVATASAALDTGRLYKSLNAGVSWTTTNIGTVLNGSAVTMLSVNQSNANELVASDGTNVWRSSNAGQSFFVVDRAGLGTITSVGSAINSNGGVSILISDTTVGVSLYATDTGSWLDTSAGAMSTGWTATETVVSAVYSPSFTNDNTIFALTDDGSSSLYLRGFIVGSAGWNADIAPSEASTATLGLPYVAATSASFAFPTSFTAGSTSTGKVFVSYNNGTVGYVARVNTRTQRTPVITSPVTNLQIGSVVPSSIDYKGTITTGTLVAGLVNAPDVYSLAGAGTYTSNFNWNDSTQSPLGGAASNTLVKFSPISTTLYAGTAGAPSGLSTSTDYNSFVGVAFVSVSSFSNVSFPFGGLTGVGAPTQFQKIYDSGYGTYLLFKSTDSGATWKEIYNGALPFTVFLSPAYATDSTIYLTQNTSKIVVSNDGGATWNFNNVVGTSAISAFAPIDGTNYYAGYANGNGIRASNSATTVYLDGGMPLAIIGLPGALLVWELNGAWWYSTDNGATFTTTGADTAIGFNGVFTFGFTGTNWIIYQLDSTGNLESYTVGVSTGWSIYAPVSNFPLAAGLSSLTMGPGGVWYADYNGVAGSQIYRTTTTDLSKATAASWEVVPGSATATLGAIGSIPGLTVAADASGFNTITTNVTTSLLPSTTYATKWVIFTDSVVKAPVTVSPAAASVQNNTIGNTSLVDFTWTAANHASAYNVQVAYDAAFTNMAYNSLTANGGSSLLIAGTSLSQISLLPAKTYYWRVRIAVASPMASAWSAPVQFTTTGVSSVSTGLDTVGSIYPDQGAVITGTTLTFTWGSVTGVDTYEFTLTKDGTVIDSQKGLTNTVYTETGLATGAQYTWAIRAITGGVAGPWVNRAFTTIVPPATNQAPTTTAPAITVPTPVVTVNIPTQSAQPQATYTVNVTTNGTSSNGTPAWAWIVIAIGAVLVIAVIVLIVRTRKV
jgi:hypothetical protein